ncbi:MAG: DegV family protein [Oscillospiraceae bacterium]|nr:DegV family protein [Oscillospiraceae bacterium]
MSVRIIVDSTADVSPASKARLTVVPLTIHFGTEEYVDGVTISHKEFYDKLVTSDVLPTTSQPTPAAFADVFEQAAAEGDSAVVITISSKLSGTYQSACIAAEDFDNVYVVDSRNAAIGSGCLVEYALNLVDRGMGAEEIARTLTQERENIRLFAVLDTLEYLKKGGRISSAVAFVGGMLSIKPVITVADGLVGVAAKARGARQGITTLMNLVEGTGGIDTVKPFLLGYSGNDAAPLGAFAEKAADLWNGQDAAQTQMCSVIGTHIGPGAVAVAYFTK